MRFLSSTALLILTLSAISLTGCSESKSLTETKIQAIKKDMSPAEVKAILGQPKEIETSTYLQINAEYYSYSGPAGTPTAGILFLQDKVWRIDSPLPTSLSTTP